MSDLTVHIVSFGFKNGPPPLANLVLDVRFLKNPYWVESLRPLTGLDTPVAEYVLEQDLARDVLDNLETLLGATLPAMLSVKADSFVIALGCTGGVHRSTAMVEALAEQVRKNHPEYRVVTEHRDLESARVSNLEIGDRV